MFFFTGTDMADGVLDSAFIVVDWYADANARMELLVDSTGAAYSLDFIV